MCPICKTTLELSNSPAGDQIRREIQRGIDAGRTESEIKAGLVAQFGEEVLAAPPREGFNLLAWILPLAGGLVGGCRARGGGSPLAAGRPNRRAARLMGGARARSTAISSGASTRSSPASTPERLVEAKILPVFPGRTRLVRDAVRSAARTRLSLGRLRDAAGATRPRVVTRRAAVSRRLHAVFVAFGASRRGARRASRRRRGNRPPASSSWSSAWPSSACCPFRG